MAEDIIVAVVSVDHEVPVRKADASRLLDPGVNLMELARSGTPVRAKLERVLPVIDHEG